MAPSPDAERVQRHAALFQTNAETIALIAREGYAQYGRGAVVYHPRLAEKPGYVTGGTAEQWGDTEIVDGWPDRRAARLVASYDPARELIFIVVEPDGCVVAKATPTLFGRDS
jgi:hypothetical protein